MLFTPATRSCAFLHGTVHVYMPGDDCGGVSNVDICCSFSFNKLKPECSFWDKKKSLESVLV